jgi:hypothetical protein
MYRNRWKRIIISSNLFRKKPVSQECFNYTTSSRASAPSYTVVCHNGVLAELAQQ